jgi:hypothetical protein
MREVEYDLVYRGSKHGFTLPAWYRQLSGKSNLLVICQSRKHNQVFGGFTSLEMKRPPGYYKAYSDPKAFIF